MEVMSSFKKLPKAYQNIVKTWKNQTDIKGANLNSLSWVIDNAKEVEEYIKKYNSINTRKTHFQALSRVAKDLGKNVMSEKYSVIATDLNKQHVEKAKEQKPKENGLTWSTIMKRREEMKKITKKYPLDYRSHLNYLIISLYSYQPPIRSEYSDMIFTKEKPTDKSENYLWKHGDKYTIVLNYYKTDKTYGQANIDIVSKRLREILNDSFSKFPRKYVLSLISNKKEPMDYQNLYYYRMPEIGKQISVNNLRSAYVTQFYNNRSMDEKDEKEEHNHKDKEKLAKQMNHSAEEAYKTYFKLTGTKIEEEEKNIKKKQKEYQDKKKEEKKQIESDSETESEDEDEKKKIESDSETESEDEDEKKVQPKKKFDRKAYAKEYRKKHPEKYAKYAKKYYENNKTQYLRTKILYELNSGNTSNPKPQTIEKYKLKYDKESKKWY